MNFLYIILYYIILYYIILYILFITLFLNDLHLKCLFFTENYYSSLHAEKIGESS